MISANPLGAFLKASFAATGVIATEIAIVTTAYFLSLSEDIAVSAVKLVLGVLGMAINVAVWSIIPAFTVTFATISTLGLPTLWLLDRYRRATAPLCAAVGAGFGLALGALIGSLVGAAAASAALLLLPGAVAGWTVWTNTRGAGPTPPRPPAPPS